MHRRAFLHRFLTAATALVMTAGIARAQRPDRLELVARVGDASTGQPLSGASVWVPTLGITTRTDSLGVARLKGVPAGSQAIAFSAPGYEPRRFQVIFDTTGVIHTDVRLTPLAKPEGARKPDGTALVAHVRDESTGQPIANAAVSVDAAGASALSDSSGVARLGGVPQGTQMVRVSALGYADKEFTIPFGGAALMQADVRLTPAALVLAPLHVTAEQANAYLKDSGFYSRERASGGGSFLSGAALAKIEERSYRVEDLFRRVPGFTVREAGGADMAVVSTRGATSITKTKCSPEVFIDGSPSTLMLVSLQDIAAVEAYPSSVSAPIEYGTSACGTILIWTWRGLQRSAR